MMKRLAIWALLLAAIASAPADALLRKCPVLCPGPSKQTVAQLPNFSADGASRPWFGNGVEPSAIYLSSLNTTAFFWDAYQPSLTNVRVVEMALKNWTTGAWSGQYLVGANNALPPATDNHGVASTAWDGTYIYMFYAAHATGTVQYSVINPNSPFLYASYSLSLNATFVLPFVVGTKIYLLYAGQGVGTGPQQCLCLISGTISAGVVSWGSQVDIQDDSGVNGWTLPGVATLSGTQISLTWTHNTVGTGAATNNVYYGTYDTDGSVTGTSGSFYNYGNTFAVAPTSFPISSTSLNTNFQIETVANVGETSLCVDQLGNPNVIWASSSTGTIQYTNNTGSGWSAPHTVYTYPAQTLVAPSEFMCIPDGSNGINLFYGDGAVTSTSPASSGYGNIREVNRSSGGSWTNDHQVQAYLTKPLGSVSAIANGTASTAFAMWTEESANEITLDGTLRGYAYGANGNITRTTGFGLINPTGGTATGTFDPAKTATDLTLSGGNLVLTTNTSNGAGSISLGNTSHALGSGKFYFEVTVTTLAGVVGSVEVGLSNASKPVNSAYLGYDSFLSIGAFGTSSVKLNSATLGNWAGIAAQGDVIGVAVDLINGYIFFRKNGGTWDNNAADIPYGPHGGFSLASITGPFFIGFESQTIGNVLTLNTGQSAFAFAIPPNYQHW